MAKRGDTLRFPAHSSPRWLNCLGSVREVNTVPFVHSSIYADEGIFAHAISENCGKMECDVKDLYQPGETITLEKVSHEIDNDMIVNVQDHRDYVSMVASSCTSPSVYCELKLSVADWTVAGQQVTIDDLILDVDGTNTVHIIDLKYGKGVTVDAYENEQLGLYSLAVYDYLMGHCVGGDVNDSTVFKMHISQPRRTHTDSWEMTLKELLSWGEHVRKTVSRVVKNSDLPLVPGDKQCRFCPVKDSENGCRALADASLSTASEGFGNLIEPMAEAQKRSHPDIELKDVNSLTPEEIFDCLHNVDMVRIFLKALEAQAQTLLESHKAPDDVDFKLVRSKTNRAWADEVKADRALQRAGLDVKTRYQPRQLLTPPQAEKLIGKKHLVMSDKYVHKPTGGITIARMSDKRDAVNIDPTEGFESVEDLPEDLFG